MKDAMLYRGRVFVLRLTDGEVLHEAVEDFCKYYGIVNATVTAVGGVDAGSEFVSGPTLPIDGTIVPYVQTLDAPFELTGTGTVFPDDEGNPILHMHGSVGRQGVSYTGCFRRRMVVWLVMEVVIQEFTGSGPVRTKSDPRIDAKLLEIRRWHPRRYSTRPSATRTASPSPSTRASPTTSRPRPSSCWWTRSRTTGPATAA